MRKETSVQIETNQFESYIDTETGLPNRHSTKKLQLEVRPTPAIQISIDIEPPNPGERSPNRPTQLIIPQLVVEQASPIKERLPIMYPGSPPPQTAKCWRNQLLPTNCEQTTKVLL